MKTGSMNQPWVQLESNRPAKVADHYAYWLEPPPVYSERCLYWVRQIRLGWLPPKRWRREGYDSSAELYGVYIWEWVTILSPLILYRIRQIEHPD